MGGGIIILSRKFICNAWGKGEEGRGKEEGAREVLLSLSLFCYLCHGGYATVGIGRCRLLGSRFSFTKIASSFP